jgi:hypothetical protein
MVTGQDIKDSAMILWDGAFHLWAMLWVALALVRPGILHAGCCMLVSSAVLTNIELPPASLHSLATKSRHLSGAGQRLFLKVSEWLLHSQDCWAGDQWWWPHLRSWHETRASYQGYTCSSLIQVRMSHHQSPESTNSALWVSRGHSLGGHSDHCSNSLTSAQQPASLCPPEQRSLLIHVTEAKCSQTVGSFSKTQGLSILYGHRLNLEFSSKTHVLKIWSQSTVLLGGGGTFRRWGLLEANNVTGHYGCALEGDVGNSAPVCLPVFLSAFWPPWMKWMDFLYHMLLPWCTMSPREAQCDTVKWPWTETSETMTQNKPFSF